MDKDHWMKLLEAGELDEILSSYSDFKDQPYAKEIIEKTIRYAADHRPGTALYYADLYKNQPYAKEVIERAVRNAGKRYPDMVILAANLFADQPYAKELLLNASEKSPLLFFQYMGYYKDQPYAKELMTKASNYIFKDKNLVFEQLQSFNYMHNSPPNIRFAALPFLTPGQKYDLITIGREEIYTSSYLTIVDNLFGDLKKKHQPLDTMLSSEQMHHMGIFLEAAASYNRVDQALNNISNAQLPEILHNIILQCGDHAKGMESCVTLATIIKSCPQNKTLRTILERELHSGYERGIIDKESRHCYGLLASLYSTTYKDTVVSEQKTFFDKIKDVALYRIPTLDSMDQSRLTDKSNVCNQLMIFASDDDSKESYKNWKKQYLDKPGWKTIDYDHFTVIEKTNGKVPIYIYANKPEEADLNAMKEIQQLVAKRQGSDRVSFQVFIGRGHSYHASDYLHYLNNKTGLVYLGSCGGYNNLSKVLKIDPGAQVISTREKGSMYVNDSLLFNLNQAINKAGEINWHQQEQKLQEIPSADKSGYLLPNKNIGLSMLDYYNKIKDAPTISFDVGAAAYKRESSIQPNKQKSIAH